MYAGLTRDANETAGTIFIAESAIILDELELEVSAAAEFRGTPGHYSERTDRGYARHHLYEAPAFRLPLIGVDSRGRSLLESWHVMGAPLILRFDASSGGTPVFSLGLVGKETAFASVGVDTAYRDGVITLEAL